MTRQDAPPDKARPSVRWALGDATPNRRSRRRARVKSHASRRAFDVAIISAIAPKNNPRPRGALRRSRRRRRRRRGQVEERRRGRPAAASRGRAARATCFDVQGAGTSSPDVPPPRQKEGSTTCSTRTVAQPAHQRVEAARRSTATRAPCAPAARVQCRGARVAR